jgi:DNA-binding NarL/FixJ family response regulator
LGQSATSNTRFSGVFTAKTQIKLSARRLQVLRCICDGSKNHEIAKSLGISSKTVEFHRSRLLKTFAVTGTAMLVRAAIRNGVIEP